MHEPAGTGRRGARRRTVRLAAVVALVLLLPVPWQHKGDSDLGVAWGMDNRLVVEGTRLDPPGRWSWLTAGRPPLVVEAVREQAAKLLDPTTPTVNRDLRVGDETHRAIHVEPVAAGAGLAATRYGSEPYPRTAAPVDAAIGGHGPPWSWLRRLATGPSHGLMVGLVTYAGVTGEDLAGGRHVAGTGTLDGEGRVGRVGGLSAKVQGARRAGVDVLLVPADQRDEIAGLDLDGLRVLAVESLHDAIIQLRATHPAD